MKYSFPHTQHERVTVTGVSHCPALSFQATFLRISSLHYRDSWVLQVHQYFQNSCYFKYLCQYSTSNDTQKISVSTSNGACCLPELPELPKMTLGMSPGPEAYLGISSGSSWWCAFLPATLLCKKKELYYTPDCLLRC